jgi:putative transposase
MLSMPSYRRAYVPGGSWFFTVNLLERRQTLLVENIESLRRAVATTRQKLPFAIDAFVVLPDHLGRPTPRECDVMSHISHRHSGA